MSLINDALKRAKQAQQKNDPPPAGTPLRPVEGARGASPKSALLPLVLTAALVLVGGILILVAIGRGEPKKSSTAPAVAANNSAPTPLPAKSPALAIAPVEPPKLAPAPAVAPVAPTSPASSAISTSPPKTQNVVAATFTTNTPTTEAPPAEPVLPKLQGIFFNPSRPSAVVSGKTVYVGSKVGEFSVIAITQQAVTVVRAGKTNFLNLEQ